MDRASLPPKLPTQKKGLPVGAKVAIAAAMLVLVFSVVTVTTGVVWLSTAEPKLTQQLAEQEAALREAGLPVTLEDLDAWYAQVPEAENAAPLYAAAFAELDKIDRNRDRIEFLRGERLKVKRIAKASPKYLKRLRKFVDDAGPTLAALMLATGRDRARFPVDLSASIDAELPHLSDMANAGRIFYLSSEAALLDGDTNLAVERHIAILSVGNALATEPTLDSQLTRIQVNDFTQNALRRLLNHAQFDDAQLQAFDAAYASSYRPELLRYAMVSARTMATATVRGLFDGTLEAEDEDLRLLISQMRMLPRTFSDIWYKYEQVHLFDAFEPLIPGPEPDWAKVTELARKGPEFSGSPSIAAMLALIFVEDAPMDFVSNVAQIRIARSALAVERYWLAHGTPPESLSDCVPDYLESVPEDPLDGIPMGYHRDAEGYTVYCVCEGLDNFYAPWAGKDGDIVFKVRRKQPVESP